MFTQRKVCYSPELSGEAVAPMTSTVIYSSLRHEVVAKFMCSWLLVFIPYNMQMRTERSWLGITCVLALMR